MVEGADEGEVADIGGPSAGVGDDVVGVAPTGGHVAVGEGAPVVARGEVDHLLLVREAALGAHLDLLGARLRRMVEELAAGREREQILEPHRGPGLGLDLPAAARHLLGGRADDESEPGAVLCAIAGDGGHELRESFVPADAVGAAIGFDRVVDRLTVARDARGRRSEEVPALGCVQCICCSWTDARDRSVVTSTG